MTTLGSSFGEQLWQAFRNNFQEQLIVLKNSNFREQLSGAALQTSFGEPFWGIGLKNRSFGAIALDSSFGDELLAATLGRSFRQPLCRMALVKRFAELQNRSFGAIALGSRAGKQLCAGKQLWTAFRTSFEAALGSSFGVLGSFFGTRLSVATLKSSFGEQGEQICGFAAALTNSCFEERQLWGVALESNFGKPLSETTFGGRLSSQQLLGAAFDNNFAEQLCGAGLGEQLWGAGAALRSSFARQL